MTNLDIYSNSKNSTEKDATDRKLERRFHDKTPEQKRAEIVEAARVVVSQRYAQITESDIAELSAINEAISNGEARNLARDLVILAQLANKAILENDKLKSDLIGFTVPIMEKHVALDQITQTLQRPNPISNAMARLD